VEGGALLPQFKQTFVVPAGTTHLAFTITGANLVHDAAAPPDAFEAALLDEDTGDSLVGTPGTLTNTDAFLNLQSTGVLHVSDQVLNSAANGSGDSVPLAGTIDVTVDLSSVPAGTVATLYFDLLGFGTQASRVSIDDVRLIGAATGPPLEFQLDPATDSGALGDDLTNISLVALLGITDPFQVVLLDLDGDGFDDGSVTADADGNFRFDNVPLAEGTNVIRMQATADGQTTVAQRTIHLDTQAPSGTLVFPAPLTVLNAGAGYVEIQWSDAGAAGLDGSTFDADDVTITGVTVDGFEDLGGGLVRYTYSGGDSLPEGTIQVQLIAGAVADLAGNINAAATFSFVIDRLGPVGMLNDPAAGSTISVDPGYVEIQWLDIGLAGLDTTSFDTDDVTVTGVNITRVEDRDDGLVRYWYDGQSLPAGAIVMTLPAGVVSDLAGNPSESATASFTMATADEPVDVTALVTVQYFGVQYNRRTGVWAFYGQVTNHSDAPLSAPIHVLWTDLEPEGSVVINADGAVTALDALILVNALNAAMQPADNFVDDLLAEALDLEFGLEKDDLLDDLAVNLARAAIR
jgi:hypothetical protein